MGRLSLRLTSVLGSCLLTAGVLAVGSIAVPDEASAASQTHVCSGTSLNSPGVLSGTFRDVVVQGVCVVSNGPAVVNGTLTVESGGALVAAFAAGHLTVTKDVEVSRDGTAILGCFASSFPCLDDPDQNSPTLNSPVLVRRDVLARGGLGVLMHDTTVRRDVHEVGGGGGVNCNPTGFFEMVGSPAYSDYEDSTVGRDLSVSGLSVFHPDLTGLA